MSSETSEWSGFYKLPINERQKKIAQACNLSGEEQALLNLQGPLSLDVADKMSENAIGTIGLPLCIAPNFLINGKHYLVPMAIEEPSVVAAASHGAKLALPEGFSTTYSGSIMIGQIQLVEIKDMKKATALFDENKQKFLLLAQSSAGHLTKYGGGVVGASSRAIKTKRGEMLIIEFHINVQDAMGANAVNTILEAISPQISQELGGEARLRILSNLATMRMASASCIWKKDAIGGSDVVEGILDAWAFADTDIYRRATHIKGIMNGIDALALACGQDWRAIESGAHSYAALKNNALTYFEKTKEGNLKGSISLPLAVGTIGGSLRVNATANLCLKILGAKTSGELAQIMAAVGLAQNFAALRALASEGIQKGHMRLHARNVAAAAGAKANEVDTVVELMLKNNKIDEQAAKDALALLQKKSNPNNVG